MSPRRRARFDATPSEARREQIRLARAAARAERFVALPRRGLLVAGADVAYAGGTAFACVVLMRVPGFEIVDARYAERPVAFPYVPGLLSFREGPALLDAFAPLPRPDAILFDAAGLAHPRRFGLARHLGYLLDVPSVGCAKSLLVGEARAPGRRRGFRTAIVHDSEVVGAALRTRDGVRPVYVSRGWALALDDCVRLVLRCGAGYRLPEPTRLADARVEAWKRARAARHDLPGG